MQTGGPIKNLHAAGRSKPGPPAGEMRSTRALVVVVILIVTFFAFYPSLHNGLLTSWDDHAYVTNNVLVKSLTPEGIIKIFKEDRGLYANYHPLTTLSLAVNYHFSKEEPFGYHLTNLLFHLLNTLLVFIFIFGLSKRNLVIAAITALLFGVTPIHVESVAWISERKDVLYAFFFLGTLIMYQQYLKQPGWKFYAASLFLFLCAMLSKAMAASLPLVLILLGYMETKRWSWKMLTDKIPFFILALLLGFYAIKVQALGNAMTGISFPLHLRVFHAGYGFMDYILKIFVPGRLSAFYPYPYPLINGAWVITGTPAVFYPAMILAVLLFVFSLFCLLSNRKSLEVAGFGLLFYTITIALVLQFLPVGRAITADRYAYIPSIGLFFIAAHYAGALYNRKPFNIVIMAMVILYAGFLFAQTQSQSRVWNNDVTLWSNVIRIYPSDNRIAMAYENRARYYVLDGKPREALGDLQQLLQSNTRNEEIWYKAGKIYQKDLKNTDSAFWYFLRAYEVNPLNVDVIKDLSASYGMKGDYKKSLELSLHGLELYKDNPPLLFNTGITYCRIGQVELGQKYMNKALALDPSVKPK